MQEKGLVSGGVNGFDGDYYKARWDKTGVIEADCLVCHLPGYHYEERNKQIKLLNFRWAATAGAGLGQIVGAVKEGSSPRVVYNLRFFDAKGRVKLHFVKEVPRENCLFCHKESDYKKRGASYKARDDVHTRAGLRCVDCHWAGSRARDRRIAGLELHEIGKGDDPGGHVRDDLDNTVRPCLDCHGKGLHGAPKALHRGLPPRHLEKLACQTCHVPYRTVKAALVQDATHFNPAPGISPPPKRIWTFYGPDAKPWNYYGELHQEGTKFQRPFLYIPEKVWYEGKIWPMNRVHSAWVGFIKPDLPGIDMVFMVDYFRLWKEHLADPQKNFPALNEIRDDNLDGVPEVNKPEEIKALLKEVKRYLELKGKFPREARLVFVKDAAYTEDGKNWTRLKRFPWEATPYASVFKYSHDIYPAKAALGSKGCADCHSGRSPFFYRPVLTSLWDGQGKLSFRPNYEILGYSAWAVKALTWRQEVLEPVMYYGLLLFFFVFGLSLVFYGPHLKINDTSLSLRLAFLILTVALIGPALSVILGRFFAASTLGHLASLHKVVGILGGLAALYLFFSPGRKGLLFALGALLILYQILTGAGLIFLQGGNLRQIIFTLHDLGALLTLAWAGVVLLVNSFWRRIK